MGGAGPGWGLQILGHVLGPLPAPVLLRVQSIYGECVVKVARALGRLFGIRSFSYTLIREDASAEMTRSAGSASHHGPRWSVPAFSSSTQYCTVNPYGTTVKCCMPCAGGGLRQDRRAIRAPHDTRSTEQCSRTPLPRPTRPPSPQSRLCPAAAIAAVRATVRYSARGNDGWQVERYPNRIRFLRLVLPLSAADRHRNRVVGREDRPPCRSSTR